MEISTYHKLLSEEANAWFSRNYASLEGKTCSVTAVQVLDFLKKQKNFESIRILEIGCCYGYNLSFLYENLKNLYKNIFCYGIDIGDKAIEFGQSKYGKLIESGCLELKVASSDSIPYNDSMFHVIICGFMFYLVNRKLIFKTECEIDRCLKDNGFLVITDFDTPNRFIRDNKHNASIPCYKNDYGFHFYNGGGYSLIEKSTYCDNGEEYFPLDPQKRVSTQILYKESVSDYYLR